MILGQLDRLHLQKVLHMEIHKFKRGEKDKNKIKNKTKKKNNVLKMSNIFHNQEKKKRKKTKVTEAACTTFLIFHSST